MYMRHITYFGCSLGLSLCLGLSLPHSESSLPPCSLPLPLPRPLSPSLPPPPPLFFLTISLTPPSPFFVSLPLSVPPTVSLSYSQWPHVHRAPKRALQHIATHCNTLCVKLQDESQLIQSVRARDYLIPRSSVRFCQKPRSQIYMDVNYIDPQSRVLSHSFK